MDDQHNVSCSEFIDLLASSHPTPGGGAAVAYVGAVGTALGNMVAELTVAKEKYAAVEEKISLLSDKASEIQKHLLILAKRDEEVFAPLARIYKLQASTPEEKACKKKRIQLCLKTCAEVPLEVMEVCANAIALHREFATYGAQFAISDVGCGVICCKAGLQGAYLNVLINLRSMEDTKLAHELRKRAQSIYESATFEADQVFADVKEKLS